jgi:transposase
MPSEATKVVLSARLRAMLERLARARLTPACIAERCNIALMSADGVSNEEQGRGLGVDRQRVRRWRTRWGAASERLAEAERDGATDSNLEDLVVSFLMDSPRPGAPPKFTPEQIADIIALACEPPADSGRPVPFWTPRELAMEAAKRKIVESISPRQLDRILTDADLRPHKSRYWMTSRDKREDPERYEADVRNICDTYLEAPKIASEGGHVVSTDEKTGMQAIEREHPTKPTRRGLVERVEFEYIRHGTLCLIANRDVVTGRIIAPSIGPTRTEADFAAHINRTIDLDPEGRWIFVTDQLNTHVSEELVKMVAKRCNITSELGVKGESGVLESMKTRRAFLEDPTHRIRFVYTPRHCSWLNQVELWFSILARRLLKRSSFLSLNDLKQKVLAFIDHFNAVLAKPFRWTFTGRPLQA